MPEFETTQRDATNVVPPDPRAEAIYDAHADALDSVAAKTWVATELTYRNTRNVPAAIIVGAVTATARGYHDCYASCHYQNPPKEPPVPEIDTGEEEEEKEKEKENDN